MDHHVRRHTDASNASGQAQAETSAICEIQTNRRGGSGNNAGGVAMNIKDYDELATRQPLQVTDKLREKLKEASPWLRRSWKPRSRSSRSSSTASPARGPQSSESAANLSKIIDKLREKLKEARLEAGIEKLQAYSISWRLTSRRTSATCSPA